MLAILFALAMGGRMVAASDAAPLSFVDGWVREAPPTAQVLAGYGSFRNVGAQPLRITGASSADFGRVELHEMDMADGVMRMRKLDAIEVPASGSFALEPGAIHLMLFEPKHALAAGATVDIEFHSGEQRFRATLTVREP
jgi:hypothetical protein